MKTAKKKKKTTKFNQISPNKTEQNKCSFFIDNLLGNETNISSATSSSSETNSPFQHLLHPTNLNLLRKLTFLSDFHNQQQQVYW